MYKMLIDGQLVEGSFQLDVVNPATGEVFASCARANASQVNLAVQAARNSFVRWSTFSFDERADHLSALADAMETRFDDFAKLLTQEQGKPLPEAQFEIGGSIASLRFFAKARLVEEVVREDASHRIIRQRTPLGVVAAITPWNFPVILLMNKIGPALITGNTVVAKPAPTTPLTTLMVAEIAAKVLPAGVLNVIIDQNDLGEQLTRHPDVAKVSFTGSTPTGRKVMHSVADTLKRVTLELGGNDAALVLDDVDVKEVAPQVFSAAMVNAGQVCLAAKRVYVPVAMYDAFCVELAALANTAVVGDGLKLGTQIGPVQNREQYEKLLGFLDDARSSGKIIAGGAPTGEGGYFIPPTIVRDISDDARLVCEEQFGPVLPILAYADLEDAVKRINNSDFGLGATIWAGDPQRGLAVARRIESGTVWVNKHLDLPFDLPYEGSKQSGMGKDGLEEYTQAKTINMAI